MPHKTASLDQDAIYAKVLTITLTIRPLSVLLCIMLIYADMHSNSVSVQVWNRETREVVQADASGCQWDEVGEIAACYRYLLM